MDGAAGDCFPELLKAPTLGFAAGSNNVYLAQSVLAGQLASGALVSVVVAADCAAGGTVTSTSAACCSAESVTSAEVAALPVLVVIMPTIDAGS